MNQQHSKINPYAERLHKQILENSESSDWASAVLEWEIHDWHQDSHTNTSCLCGKENLKYLFSIKNKQNGTLLGPIGSQCIKKFERHDLNEQTANFEKLFKIQAALSKNKFIGLSSELFSKKLIEFFYDQDVYDINDFNFLMNMFNKKDKSKITANQQKKINYHIIAQIIPYLKSAL